MLLGVLTKQAVFPDVYPNEAVVTAVHWLASKDVPLNSESNVHDHVCPSNERVCWFPQFPPGDAVAALVEVAAAVVDFPGESEP